MLTAKASDVVSSLVISISSSMGSTVTSSNESGWKVMKNLRLALFINHHGNPIQ